MQVSVHGGTHKTGTTAVQHVLELNRTRLAEAGVFVPAVSHHDLLSAKRPGWSPTGCLQVIEDARKNGFEHIVLSGETVSTFSFDQFRNLSACFEELDPDLRLLFSTLVYPSEFSMGAKFREKRQSNLRILSGTDWPKRLDSSGLSF